MKATEFNKRLVGLNNFMTVNTGKMEDVSNWCGTKVNVFQYAATSERCMEKNLAQVGKERKTTFMADLSMGEWYGRKGVLDTIKNAMKSWKDDEEYMAEFVLCVNWKAWEHDARKHTEWAKFYSLVYEFVRDLMYDYYEGNAEKSSFLFNYLD